MAYNVCLTKKAEKEFERLQKQVVRQIAEVFELLENDPFSQDIKKLKTPFEGYRIRSGDYRVLFVIEGDDIIIYSIKHRKDAYKF